MIPSPGNHVQIDAGASKPAEPHPIPFRVITVAAAAPGKAVLSGWRIDQPITGEVMLAVRADGIIVLEPW
jgi:hypothetical protein